MKLIALLGAGGYGKVAVEILEKLDLGVINFFDKSWPEFTQCGYWNIVADSKKN